MWAPGHVASGSCKYPVMGALGVGTGSREHRGMGAWGHVNTGVCELWVKSSLGYARSGPYECQVTWALGYVNSGSCKHGGMWQQVLWALTFVPVWLVLHQVLQQGFADGQRAAGADLSHWIQPAVDENWAVRTEQHFPRKGKGHSSTVLTICSLTLLLLADQELKTFIKNIYKNNNLLSLKIQTNSKTPAIQTITR